MKAATAPIAMRSWALFDPRRQAFLAKGGGLTTTAENVLLFPFPAAVPERDGMETVPVDVHFDTHGHPAEVEIGVCEI